jgi:Na+/melibiose symporter-like transporter
VVDNELYEQARRRVEAKIGFFTHLAVYIVINGLLIFINLQNNPDRLWFYWPLLGWGIGIAFHALGVFVFFSGSLLKERLIDREVRKLNEQQTPPRGGV